MPASNLNPMTFLKSDYENTIFLKPVTEIIQIIYNLKNTDSKGIDDIPIGVVIFCKNELAVVLSYINNISLNTGIFSEV